MELLNEELNREIEQRAKSIVQKGRGCVTVKIKREMKKQSHVIVVGKEEACPHCKEDMQRRKQREITEKQKSQYYYFSEWDYCNKCNHVQHYEKFKVLNPTGRLLQESK